MSLFPLVIKSLQAAPLSLADLQSCTQVSLPTLRKAVQELTDQRWIRVVGQSEANGGRPAMLFGLDDSYYVVLGVHMQLPGIRMILSDLVGRVLDECEVFQGVQAGPDAAVKAITHYAVDVQARFSHRHILGVGIAAPGFTDPETGDIISIGRVPGWRDFPICQRIGTELEVPVEIANDVDCMAFAEFQHTGKSFENNLAYFGFDEGVKVSLFLNGKLYKGSFGNAGLIMSQYLHVPGDELPPEDQRQVLTISGINALLEREVVTLPDDEQQSYDAIMAASYRKRFMMIFDEDSPPVCRMLARSLYEVLSSAVANTICVIQPDTVVIGGLLSGIPETAFTSLNSAIREKLPPLFANRVRIEQANLVSLNSAALGATYHFMERYLVPDSFSGSRPFVRL